MNTIRFQWIWSDLDCKTLMNPIRFHWIWSDLSLKISWTPSNPIVFDQIWYLKPHESHQIPLDLSRPHHSLPFSLFHFYSMRLSQSKDLTRSSWNLITPGVRCNLTPMRSNWAGVSSDGLISLHLTSPFVIVEALLSLSLHDFSPDDVGFSSLMDLITSSILSMIIFPIFLISHIITSTNASTPKMANSMMPPMADDQKLMLMNGCSGMVSHEEHGAH